MTSCIVCDAILTVKKPASLTRVKRILLRFSALFFIMPDTCCANGCTNRRINVSDRIPGVKYPSFFRIPKDSNRRREWMAKISRKLLPETAKICSDHFVTGILPFDISIILCL